MFDSPNFGRVTSTILMKLPAKRIPLQSSAAVYSRFSESRPLSHHLATTLFSVFGPPYDLSINE
jgi:hypothetical protein